MIGDGLPLIGNGIGAIRLWAKGLAHLALVPSRAFRTPHQLTSEAYADASMWFSRGLGGPDDPARWQPPGGFAQPVLEAAVFFVHPTGYFDRAHWNASLKDKGATQRAELFVRGLASPFASAREIWAPRYREATLGAFLTNKPEGAKALGAAYHDVLAAFDHALGQIDPALPLVLAGHSQGTFHLMRLLRDRVAGTALAKRIAAAYLIGWPVSLAGDLPAMGLPAASGPDEAGCIVGWQSFAEPGDPATLIEAHARFPALDGGPAGPAPFLCTNPLTGSPHTSAGPEANLGTLVPEFSLGDLPAALAGLPSNATLEPRLVPAHCSPEGWLMVGPPPPMGPLVMPGNNYHVYDIPLFWANLAADAHRRTAAWHKGQRARWWRP